MVNMVVKVKFSKCLNSLVWGWFEWWIDNFHEIKDKQHRIKSGSRVFYSKKDLINTYWLKNIKKVWNDKVAKKRSPGWYIIPLYEWDLDV